MKRIHAFLALCLISGIVITTGLYAQPTDVLNPEAPTQQQEQSSGIETLIPGNARFSGYGGPVVKFSPVKGSLSTYVGGYGGLLVNSTLFIGIGGYGLANNIAADATIAPGQSLGIGYGGLVLEYIANSNQLLHYGVQMLVGYGGATYYYRGLDFNGRTVRLLTSQADGFFVVEPGVYAEVNIARWFRIGAGASYRYANGVELNGLTNSDISGVSANLTFKFGKF